MNYLSIEHDLERVLDFNVTPHERSIVKTLNKDASKYAFASKDSITVTKNNPWEINSRMNKIFMTLFAADFVFGNVFDCENLPFSVDLTVQATTCVCLSDVAVTDEFSIKMWTNAARLQTILISLVILAIGILVSFTIPILNLPVLLLSIVGVIVFLKYGMGLIATTANKLRAWIK